MYTTARRRLGVEGGNGNVSQFVAEQPRHKAVEGAGGWSVHGAPCFRHGIQCCWKVSSCNCGHAEMFSNGFSPPVIRKGLAIRWHLGPAGGITTARPPPRHNHRMSSARVAPAGTRLPRTRRQWSRGLLLSTAGVWHERQHCRPTILSRLPVQRAAKRH